MPNIFNYLNYREFLNDCYRERKNANPRYSYQVMANSAGFKSRSFIKLVIDGRKNLSEDSMEQLGSSLKLSTKSLSYFKDLVLFNQAKPLKLRNYYFSRISSYNPRNHAKLLLQNQYDFFSKWYHSTIRELAPLVDFKEDYESLARQVKPRISERQARQSVALLLKLGLLKKNNGRYEQTDKILSTGDEVQSLAIQNFHLNNILLAGESLDLCSGNERDISCLIVGLSKQSFESIKSEIQQFRKRLLKIAEEDKNPGQVYNINFHLFPTSQELK